jgi:hypothetical protein
MTSAFAPRRSALLALSLVAAYALGCSDAGTNTAATEDRDAAVEADASSVSDAGATDAASASDAGARDGGASEAPITVTAADFDCILNWQKVRGFRVKRIGGGALAESLAVANNANGGNYPPGTVLQLVPTEAMVKREPGFSPATKDWEFFALNAQRSGTTITSRGTTNVINAFGGNCFNCHDKAQPQWDLVCEQSHGCDPLPISSATIQSIQNGDPRCN